MLVIFIGVFFQIVLMVMIVGATRRDLVEAERIARRISVGRRTWRAAPQRSAAARGTLRLVLGWAYRPT